MPENPVLDPKRMPRHVAIIMDGNGRWAKQRNLPRIMGHKAGTESVKNIVRTYFNSENTNEIIEIFEINEKLTYPALRKEVEKYLPLKK